jgi:hypothetical protein
MTKISKSDSNAQNAQKSTGPKTAVGKAASSQNARRHGVLSAQLILPGEHREEFDALFSQLVDEFKPEGLLEMTLTERIAIAIWRQRRLVSAESAEMALNQKMGIKNASYPISQVLDYSEENSREIKSEWDGRSTLLDSRSSDELLLIAKVWEDAVDANVGINDLPLKYPFIYKELLDDAKSAGSTPEDFIKGDFDGISDYLSNGYGFYMRLRKQALIRELVRTYKESIALPKEPEKMSRYQSALDNDLYKAMRALRDAQSWRSERRNAEASVVVAQSE